MYNPGILVIDLNVYKDESDNKKFVQDLAEILLNEEPDLKFAFYKSTEDAFITEVIKEQANQRCMVLNEKELVEAVSYIQKDNSAWDNFDNAIGYLLNDLEENK